jgi:hypothetical protein
MQAEISSSGQLVEMELVLHPGNAIHLYCIDRLAHHSREHQLSWIQETRLCARKNFLRRGNLVFKR